MSRSIEKTFLADCKIFTCFSIFTSKFEWHPNHFRNTEALLEMTNTRFADTVQNKHEIIYQNHKAVYVLQLLSVLYKCE